MALWFIALEPTYCSIKFSPRKMENNNNTRNRIKGLNTFPFLFFSTKCIGFRCSTIFFCIFRFSFSIIQNVSRQLVNCDGSRFCIEIVEYFFFVWKRFLRNARCTKHHSSFSITFRHVQRIHYYPPFVCNMDIGQVRAVPLSTMCATSADPQLTIWVLWFAHNFSVVFTYLRCRK